jgi:AcrR family transcriptional regulator
VPPQKRKDHQRNREAILKAADEAYAENTDALSLQEIAERAGVGRATVYRHFPDRFSLAGAVADHNFGILQGALAGERFDFDEILHGVLTVQVSMRSLAAVTKQLPTEERRRLTDRMVETLTPSFRAAQERGLVHRDLEPPDLLLIMAMLEAGLDNAPAGADLDEVGQRLIGVLLRGINRTGTS